MNGLIRKLTLTLVGGFVLASAVAAQGARIVTPSGGPSYSAIQPAIDNAVDGDLILIATGTYQGFQLDGKSLSIFAVPGAKVTVRGTVVVRNLAPSQRFVLSGVDVDVTIFQVLPLYLVDNEGVVRLQDCSFVADQSTPWGEDETGASGANVTNCSRVAFLDCTILGGTGSTGVIFHGILPAGDGGRGLAVSGSDLALYDCTVQGGPGGNVTSDDGGTIESDGGGGGIGLALWSSTGTNPTSEVFASGTLLEGGEGGWESGGPPTQGIGGVGVHLALGTVLHELDCGVAGGLGVPPGAAVTGSGFHHALSGQARGLLADPLVPSGVMLDTVFLGQPGDRVHYLVSSGLGHVLLPGDWGVWLAKYPSFVTKGPQGAVPVSGQLTRALRPPQPFQSASHRTSLFQGLSSEAGHSVLSGARHVMVLSTTVGPDCNGNGMSDYWDVVNGTSPDLNNNLIPDECPGG